jgi:predicted methyltransferase
MQHNRTDVRLLAMLTLLGVWTATFAAPPDPIAAAVDDPTRTEADRSRDARDHTVEVLHFFGLAPGMVVVDLFAGGGYYSELIGRIVGAGGKVYMHNNAGYRSFVGEALTARVNSGRLRNVVQLDAEIGQLAIAPASVDLVLMSMSYHDLYFKSGDWLVDPGALFAEVHAMLKPGGILAVIDHVAKAGSGSSAAQTLHRIDEAFARADIEARGFKFTGSSDVLRNPADDHSKVVFDPSIQGHTDRFVDRFVRQ